MGKGRERIRSDRRTPKANAGGGGATKSRSKTAGGAANPKARSSRAGRASKVDGAESEDADDGLLHAPMSVDEGDHANEQDLGEEDVGDDLVGDDFAEENNEHDFYEQDDEARQGTLGGGGRLSGGDGRSSSLSNDSTQAGRASLMLEIMEPNDSLANQAGQAASANFRSSLVPAGRTSTGAMSRPPLRPPVLSKDGTPDPYAFARDELIAAPMGWGQRVVEDQGRAAVTGVSVSQVEGDELKLLEHFADVAMELDEKQLSRSITPLNDTSTVPPPQAQPSQTKQAKQPEALSTALAGGSSGTVQTSPSDGGVNGQKRKRSEDSVQFSPELELIGGDQPQDNAKRKALDNEVAPGAGQTAAAAAAAGAKPQEEKAAVGGGGSATTGGAAAAAAASDAKAHSPAVSPVDCETQAAGEAAAAAAQPGGGAGGKTVDGMARPQQSSSSHIAKTSPMVGEDAAAAVDPGRSEQPSPSAFRRLSSRGALNLG